MQREPGKQANGGERVGEVARATGLTVRTLHYYDEIGLLVPSERSDAGYRLYSVADLHDARRLRASYMSWPQLMQRHSPFAFLTYLCPRGLEQPSEA